MNFLSDESLFGRIFGFLGKMVVLNFLWIICSLPVITAGASTTALFFCVLKLHKDGDVRAVRDFFKSFKMNFLQSTAALVFMGVVGVLFYMEYKAVASMPGSMSQIFSYVIIAATIPAGLVALYIFPTIAAFKNKLLKLFTNAFYFAIKHIGYALIVAVITILPMFMTLVDAKLFPVYLFIWLMFGFSLTAYADSWFLWKLFRPYFQEEEEVTEALEEQEVGDNSEYILNK